MTRINPDYTETELCKLEEDVSRFSFGQGGVVIFGSSNDDKFMVYDLLNSKSFAASDKWLAQTEIGERVVLSDCGVSLPADDLTKILGKTFLE